LSKQGLILDNHRKDIIFEANSKSKGTAYLLWLFLGWFGVHRFYAGETRKGAAQALLTLSVVGFPITFLWWLIDIFLVPDMINERNLELLHAINSGPPGGYDPAMDEPGGARGALPPVLDEKRARMLEDLRATGHRKERREKTFY
jgi:TM2 domain-containing membrane protein YozV